MRNFLRHYFQKKFVDFLSNGDEETKEKYYEWKKMENKGEPFLNEGFVLGKLNSYLESWMKSKNTWIQSTQNS